MLLEFQLSSDVIGRVIRTQFHHADLCLPQTFQLGGEERMVNNIQVLESTDLSRADGTFPVETQAGATTVSGSGAIVTQPLQIDIVKVSALQANGAAPTAPSNSPTVEVLIDVAAVVEEGQAVLRFSFREIDFGILAALVDEPTRAQIQAAVAAKVPPVSRPIDLSSVAAVATGIDFTPVNAGVTATSAGEALVIRVEVGGAPASAAGWGVFYTTYDRVLTGGGGWALLVDKDLLEQSISSRIAGQLASESGKFSLEGGVSAAWNPGAGPVFDVSFSGEVIDACICLWGEIDLDVDVASTVTLQVPSTDVLRTHIHTTYDASDLEVFCCALTGALFWPVVGLVYLGKGDVNFGEYLLGIVGGPLGVFIAACVAAGGQSVADEMDLEGDCVKVDDETVQCTNAVGVSMPGLGVFRLASVSARNDGPVLAGPAELTAEPKAPKLNVTAVLPFSWYLGGGCKGGFFPALSGQVNYANAVPGSMLKICQVTVLDDPHDAYATLSVSAGVITISPSLTPAYLAAPYPCRLRIVSNGGVRIITLEPAQQITPQEQEKLQSAAIHAKVAKCYMTVVDVPWVIMKKEWLPYPPPDFEIAQIWQMVVSELEPGDSVELLGVRDTPLAVARPNARGVALVSHWAEGPGLLDAVGLGVRVGDLGGRQARRHVAMHQVQLVLRSRLALRGEFAGLEFARSGTRTLLSVRTTAGEAAYDVTTPAMPLVARAAGGAARGRGAGRVRVSHHENQVHVADWEGNLLSTLEGIVHKAVTAVHDFLFVLRDEDVEAYDVRGGSLSEKILLERLARGGATRIERVKVPGVRRALALVGRDGATRVVDASSVTDVREIGRYHARPWFLDAERHGKLLARLSADGRHVALYEVTAVRDE
jgi:hypothetical protein